MRHYLVQVNDDGREVGRVFVQDINPIFNPETRTRAYQAIDSERWYQDSTWRLEANREQPNQLTIGEFVLLVEEYAARARTRWTGEPKPEEETLEFIRKIAGITVNCMEQHGAPLRRGYLDLKE